MLATPDINYEFGGGECAEGTESAHVPLTPRSSSSANVEPQCLAAVQSQPAARFAWPHPAQDMTQNYWSCMCTKTNWLPARPHVLGSCTSIRRQLRWITDGKFACQRVMWQTCMWCVAKGRHRVNAILHSKFGQFCWMTFFFLKQLHI